jgi:polyisoprenoid-binding protein YceI
MTLASDSNERIYLLETPVKLPNALLIASLAVCTSMSQVSMAQAPRAGGPLPAAALAGGPAAGLPQAQVSKDPAAAPAGSYSIDPLHSSVIARTIHQGFSYNVIRFAVKEVSLAWDASNLSNVKLVATVNTKPITDPIVYRVPPESEAFLDVAKFPEAKFVSTAVRATGGNRYEIDGQLTLVGVTKPASIKATLVGAGKDAQGAVVIGFIGSMDINWVEFKGPGIASSAGIVEMQLDAEFHKR